MKIYKYVISDKGQMVAPGIYKVEMPHLSEIIKCDLQRGTLCVWAIVNPDSTMEEKTFKVAMTGEDIDLKGDDAYMGTFMTASDSYVFHVFQITSQTNINKS